MPEGKQPGGTGSTCPESPSAEQSQSALLFPRTVVTGAVSSSLGCDPKDPSIPAGQMRRQRQIFSLAC